MFELLSYSMYIAEAVIGVIIIAGVTLGALAKIKEVVQ